MPGGGFSGFWYHLGFLQEGIDEEHRYYCYSSGCLSLLLAHLNTTVDDVFDATYDIQLRWRNGNLTRYDMVEEFLELLVPRHYYDLVERFLPRMNVLLTTASTGVKVSNAAVDYNELVTLLVQTTFIPKATGKGWYFEGRDGERYLDGGFSRRLHPVCDYTVRVPMTWDTTIHTLNPGFGRETAFELWEFGRRVARQDCVQDV